MAEHFINIFNEGHILLDGSILDWLVYGESQLAASSENEFQINPYDDDSTVNINYSEISSNVNININININIEQILLMSQRELYALVDDLKLAKSSYLISVFIELQRQNIDLIANISNDKYDLKTLFNTQRMTFIKNNIPTCQSKLNQSMSLSWVSCQRWSMVFHSFYYQYEPQQISMIPNKSLPIFNYYKYNETKKDNIDDFLLPIVSDSKFILLYTLISKIDDWAEQDVFSRTISLYLLNLTERAINKWGHLLKIPQF